MNLRMIGCTHRASGVDLRQQLAFGSEQTSDALAQWREQFPTAEFALLSTCNRVELYAAGRGAVEIPETDQLVDALLSYHGVPSKRVVGQIMSLAQREATGSRWDAVIGRSAEMREIVGVLRRVAERTSRGAAASLADSCGSTGRP